MRKNVRPRPVSNGMKPEENILLSEHTTFKIGGPARYFFRAKSVRDLKSTVAFARQKNLPFFVLGGGSNLLVSDKGFSGVVIKNEILGVSFLDGGEFVEARAAAGESWDDFVAETARRGLFGLENLSGIPGTVGGAPVQNIGAYGAEVKDMISRVEVFDAEAGVEKTFGPALCRFGYRRSFFKTPEGRRHIITGVSFRLRKNGQPNLEYKDLKEIFNFPACAEAASVTRGQSLRRRSAGRQFSIFSETERQKKMESLTPAEVRKAVLKIRRGKFPDLKKTGTAGSFFKNPIISKEQYDKLKKRYPALPAFPLDDEWSPPLTEMVKLPLAWILDNILHFKGFMMDGVGLYRAQPLVIVNEGAGTEGAVSHLAEEVARKVQEATGIRVEWEVERLP